MVCLQDLLEQTLSGMGYELVEFEFGHSGLLRIFIDKLDGINIDDCVLVSNHLTRLLVVENIDYTRLEVSSPGLDRVLNKPSDFLRFAGEQVKVKLRFPLLSGQRNLVGKLLGFEDEQLVVESENGALKLSLPQIDRVRLEPVFKKPARFRRKK